MRRVIPNIIEDADAACTCTTDKAGDLNRALRYGADLLGRAIGHEQFGYEAPRDIDPTMFYSNLVHEIIGNRTHRIMAFRAAREV